MGRRWQKNEEIWTVCGEKEKKRKNVIFNHFLFVLYLGISVVKFPTLITPSERVNTFVTVPFSLPGLRDQCRKQRKKMKGTE